MNEIDPDEGETVFTSFVEDHHHAPFDLISMGARPIVPEQRGGHPLIYAVWCLDYGLLRGLLQSGADPNHLAFDQPGESPSTALDAVADQFHCDDDPHAHAVLNAMEALLKQHGGKYAYEQSASHEGS